MAERSIDIKVVAVSPKYQLNVGYIARVSANFGVKNIEIVNPRCNIHGKTAIKYSKAARKLLESAKLSRSLEKSISGTFSIATTGIWRKGGAALGNIYTPEQAASIIRKSNQKLVSIVLGRDDTGLHKEEIEKCDIVVFIPTAESYPVLNISHALSILLYIFTYSNLSKLYSDSFEGFFATQNDKDALSRLFKLFVNKNSSIKDKASVSAAFKRVIDKSHPTKKELNSIAAAISPKHILQLEKRKRAKQKLGK